MLVCEFVPFTIVDTLFIQVSQAVLEHVGLQQPLWGRHYQSFLPDAPNSFLHTAPPCFVQFTCMPRCASDCTTLGFFFFNNAHPIFVLFYSVHVLLFGLVNTSNSDGLCSLDLSIGSHGVADFLTKEVIICIWTLLSVHTSQAPQDSFNIFFT